MGFIDDAKAAATMPIPGPGAPDDVARAFDSMPIAELAARWRMIQFAGVRQQTGEIWEATLIFDRLPHESPARAYAMVLSVLAAETDTSVLLRLKDVMSTLVHAHGGSLIDRIEQDARDNDGLRWLLGGAYWWARDQAIQDRLLTVADVEAFRADDEAHSMRNPAIDYDQLSIDELARQWIAQTEKPFKGHDRNWSEFDSYTRDLIEADPDAAVDLVLAVLRIETDPSMLAVLAAGLLENTIDMRVIDRIEREAAADPRFLALLRGVWYSSKPDDVKARLDAILNRSPEARV